MMVDFRNVKFTAVILLLVCVQWTWGKAMYPGWGEDTQSHYNSNRLTDDYHKHVATLKTPDPAIVETVRKRIKASMKGRRVDQSNERNIWTSHPKNENYMGPDTQEVIQVINSLGI